MLARGEDDRWTLSIDSSGELLHRRGWRLETAQAPLRETLAAALVLLCEWDPATPLVDPGTSHSLTVTFTKVGKYEYLCTVPGHAAAGMRGLLTVTR